MPVSQRIAFIGAGNMASALIHGLVSSGTARADQILASDAHNDALDRLRTQHGIRVGSNLDACGADIVILSVKPQVLPGVLAEIAQHVVPRSLVVSIAAGVPVRALERSLPQARVVRAMPNTPALVSAGMTALAMGQRATEQDMQLASAVFESVGLVVHVPDELMDAVTALSGSGPAYAFLLVEALADAGARLGLPVDVAATLAAQTLYGAGKLMRESTEPAAVLRQRVTSPGGTTAAGIAQLEAHNFRGIIDACLVAARDRGRELGSKL